MDEHREAVEVFMIAMYKIRYDSTGKAIGLDLDTVIEIIKLIKVNDPISTIQKVMFLSNELIQNAN